MQTVLIPTDFSDNAWNALFTALKLFPKTECRFLLLHAYEPKAMNMLGKKSQIRLGTIYDSLKAYSEQELRKTKQYLEKHHANSLHHFELISKSATLEEAVVEMMAEHDIDLIVMGTQGATGAEEIYVGSNTVRVLRQVKKLPVLIVPSGFNFQNLKKAVFPTDFTRGYEKFELEALTNLLSSWNAELDILYIAVAFHLNDKQLANKALLESRLTQAGIIYRFKEEAFDASISRSVANYTREHPVELLGMIRYHHSFWEKLIGEPVIKKVAFHAEMPVLMLAEH